MKFTKMQGCGNDYIFIDATTKRFDRREELAVRMSDRHFGVGSDGLVFIENSDVADFKMDFYNGDGSPAAMCGTAVRCLCKFVYESSLTLSTQLCIETAAGVKYCHLKACDGMVNSVTVEMGRPIFDPVKIPVDFNGDRVFGYPLKVDNEYYYINAVSMGNPHAVIFCKDVAQVDVLRLGDAISNHPFFPQRTNVEFIYPCGNDISMRVFERGAGETLSCGTGACAAAVVATMTGMCGENVNVHTKGGTLEVFYDKENNEVYLKGECVKVFDGNFTE